MYSSSEQVSASEQAGKALMSVAWETRKEAKRALSEKSRARSHWKRRTSAVKLDQQIRKTGSTIAQGVDAAVDRFVERVERVIAKARKRDGGIEELLDRLDRVMPAQAPELREP